MNVDESLLARKKEFDEELDDQDETEDEFSDNIEEEESEDFENEEEVEEENEPQSLREAVMMAKAKENEAAKEKLKKAGTELKQTAEAAASSKFLTMCFSSKGISASYGLSPLYGNVHLFLKYTVNDKLRALNLKEGMMLLLWDLVLLLIIIIIISLIALVVGFIKNPFEAIKGILQDIFPLWKNII